MNNSRPKSNSELFPEAWKVYEECVRKWETNDIETYSSGWKYGIPNPCNPKDYLYCDCPGKLFQKFKDLYYSQAEIGKFREFLTWLECMEGKR
jgi:hypothetical protein